MGVKVRIDNSGNSDNLYTCVNANKHAEDIQLLHLLLKFCCNQLSLFTSSIENAGRQMLQYSQGSSKGLL